MDIILLLLAKPLDKHGITLVHITYTPLVANDKLQNTQCVALEYDAFMLRQRSVCGDVKILC